MTPIQRRQFLKFLDALDDYLYAHGWYINGYYIKKKCKSYKQVEQYLVLHCYDGLDAKRIITRLRRKTEI